ncbi:MAG: serine/threonine protein kinase [Deltaproteobacteria bacterium]|nr:serine/threonine protein kinase [Deltaproteobacteria bacterium]
MLATEGAAPGSSASRGSARRGAPCPIAAAPTRSDGGWGAALLPGATIGKFELVREIGSGGFGVVWEARDRELGRRVAFKAVRAGGKAGLREERLLREAEAAARLTHPNIVTLHDLGRAEAGPYLVLELLSGQTLEERLHEGKLPVAEAVRIAAEVAKGVAHAHAQGVVHRDLKPANVFLCQDGQVKVLDFGLAHAFGQRRQDGGTPAYMAPEQWEGAPEDERTDVFALGVMLFRMLSGELPYPDAEGKDHRSKEPAPALEIAEQPELGALVGRMLAKRPVERPRDGAEVAAALKEFQHQLELAPASGPSAVRTRKRPGLRLAGLLALGVAVGALLAGGVAWWRPERAPRPVASADGRIVVAVADVVNETGCRRRQRDRGEGAGRPVRPPGHVARAVEAALGDDAGADPGPGGEGGKAGADQGDRDGGPRGRERPRGEGTAHAGHPEARADLLPGDAGPRPGGRSPPLHCQRPGDVEGGLARPPRPALAADPERARRGEGRGGWVERPAQPGHDPKR